MMRALSAICLSLLFCSASPVSGQTPPAADPLGIRGDFSGSWYHPAQSGHGLLVEVLDDRRAAVAWFTFAPDGSPLWLTGVLEVAGDRLSGDLETVAGGRFPPQFDPAQVTRTPWGSVELVAGGCDSATLSWQALDPAFGSDSLALERLTAMHGQRCNVEEEFVEQRSYHFERGAHRFEPLFVDLPVEGHDIYELDFGWEPLPAPLSDRRGLRLTGHNRSDDLAMFITAPVGGLLPSTAYRVEIEMELASNVPTGCAGIGGSPGDSVYLKLGVAGEAPQAVTVDEGGFPTLRANIDIGVQSQDGEQVEVVGTLANRQTCEDLSLARWQLKTHRTSRPLTASTDDSGRLWVIAGSDSAFEGLTSYYITALRVRLLPGVDE